MTVTLPRLTDSPGLTVEKVVLCTSDAAAFGPGEVVSTTGPNKESPANRYASGLPALVVML